MNGISKSKANLWSKIMNGKGLHFKILMVVLMLFTGLYFSQQMNVQADPAMTAEEQQCYGVPIKESDGIYYYLHMEGYYPTNWDSYMNKDHFGFVLADDDTSLDWWMVDEVGKHWLKIKLSGTSTDAELSRLRNSYMVAYCDQSNNSTEFDLISYNNNTEGSKHYRRFGTATSGVHAGRFILSYNNGYGNASAIYFNQKYDAIHFTSTEHSEYNGKSASFTPFSSVDLLSSTFDGSGTTEQKLNNNVSVYRVFRRDGEEKRVKVTPSVYGTTVDETPVERAMWTDSTYTGQNNVKYKMEMKEGSRYCAYKRDGRSASENNNVETDYFNTSFEHTFSTDICNCIAQKPSVKVLNLRDSNRDITNASYFTNNYETTFVTTIQYDITTDTPYYMSGNFTVKNKNNDYMPLSNSDFRWVDYSNLSYHREDSDSDGTHFYFNCTSSGEASVGVSPLGRRIWVGSANESPWLNDGLWNNYVLKQGTNTINGTDADTSKGAWYYDCYGAGQSDGSVTFSPITFQMCGKRGRDFSSSWAVNNASNGMSTISGTSLKYATADNGNNIGGQGDPSVKSENCVEFSVTPSVAEPQIKVTGQKYTVYRLVFTYENSNQNFRLTDVLSSLSCWHGGVTADESTGNYVYEFTAVTDQDTGFDLWTKADYCFVKSELGYTWSTGDDAGFIAWQRYGNNYATGRYTRCVSTPGHIHVTKLQDQTIVFTGGIRKNLDLLRVLDLNSDNRDITNKNYFTNNYKIEGEVVLNEEDRDSFTVNSLKVKLTNTDSFAGFSAGDAEVLSNNASVSVSGNEINIVDYSGTGDIRLGIKPFRRRIWVGSNNQSPWENATLGNQYVLKQGSVSSWNTIGAVGNTNGAWCYDCYGAVQNDGSVTFSPITFQMCGKRGRDFVKEGTGSWAVNATGATVSGTSLGYATADSGNDIGAQGDPSVKSENCVTFSVTPSVVEPKIVVTGQKYTKYRMSFKYENSRYNYKLTDALDCIHRWGGNYYLQKDTNAGTYYVDWDISYGKSDGYDLYTSSDYYFEKSSLSYAYSPADASFSNSLSMHLGKTFGNCVTGRVNNKKLQDQTVIITGGIRKYPKLHVVNLNDNNTDITGMGYFTSNYATSGSLVKISSSGASVANDVTLKPITDTQTGLPNYAGFTSEDVELKSGSADISVSDGTITVKCTDVDSDVVIGIKPFKRHIWFGTETTGADPLWANRGLATGYLVKKALADPGESEDITDPEGTFKQSFTRSDIKSSENDSNYENGAWYYEYYEQVKDNQVTNSSFWFEMIGRTGYEFENNADATGSYKKVQPKMQVKLKVKLEEKKDENGNPVYEQKLDEQGNPVYEQKKDANGNLVYDENGDAIFEPVYVQERDASGNLVYDASGNPVYKKVYVPVTDANGNLVYEQELDANGNPVYDADGNPVYKQELDANGNPVYEQVLDAQGHPVYEPVYVQKKDENGNLVYDANGNPVYEPELDENNNPVYEQKVDEYGNLVYNASGEPVYDESKPVYKQERVNSCTVDNKSIGYAYKDLPEDILEYTVLEPNYPNGEHRYNCVQFKVSSVTKGEARVVVSGHKYREYQNVFKSLDSPHKLANLVKFDGIERTNSNGDYVQAWTVGSIFNKDYTIKAKQGYIINGSDFKVEVSDNMQRSYKNEAGYFDRYDFSLSNINKQNYVIKVGGIKAVREMNFKSSKDISVTDSNQKTFKKVSTSSEGTGTSSEGTGTSSEGTGTSSEETGTSSEETSLGGTYSLNDACMDLVGYPENVQSGTQTAAVRYKAKIELKDAKREFIADEELAEKIKESNDNLLACEAKRSSADTSILELTLTLRNTVNTDGSEAVISKYNIELDDDITKFRDCDVQFDFDMNDAALANSVYYNQIINNMKITYVGVKKDNTFDKDDSAKELVPLRLINGHFKSVEKNPVLYNKIGYKIELGTRSNPDEELKPIVDLRKLNVSLGDNGEGAGAVKIIDASATSITIQFDADAIVDADYRKAVTFSFKMKDVMRSKEIDLCASSVLYEVAGEGADMQKNKIVTAEYEEMYQDVPVPINGTNTFHIQYTDYSQTFDVSNILVEDESKQTLSVTEGSAEPGSTMAKYEHGRATVIVKKTGDTNTVEVTVTDKEPTTSASTGEETTSQGSTEDIVKIICNPPASTSPPIRFTAIDGVKYYEVEKDGNGNITIGKPIQGTINALVDEDFSFAVKCDDGYDINTLELKANKNAFGKTGDFTWQDKDGYRIFTIAQKRVNSPYVISGRVDIRQLNIKFETTIGKFGKCSYVYNGSTTTNLSVLYGEGISFSVNLPDECNQSDAVVKFTPENGDAVTLEKVNDQYLLNNIVSSGTISVDAESLKTNQYPIAFTANDKAVYKQKDGQPLSGTRTVEHGGEYSFRVQPLSGYSLDDAVVLIKYSDGNRKVLHADANGVYSTSEHGSITQPCTISVENVDEVVYNIKLIPTLGVTYLNGSDNVIKDSVQVKHGRNFEFAISLDDAYDDSKDGMSIIVNDGKSSKSSAQKLASGRYVINSVEEDITIKVGNVSKNTYTVSLRGAEGIDYYDASGNIITGDNTVEHYSDFSFKVDLYPAYSDSNITVMLGDTPMTPDGNGFYTISKITESKTVTVIGIEQSSESELINKIGSLPDSLSDLGDVDDVIAATKQYEALPDDKKALVSNIDKLKDLQEQAKAFHHVSNDVKIDGVDWYIKLYAIPITEDVDACGRIYKKLNNEYILSLYNVYLWNTLEDTRYYLPEGQSAVITLPTPDMTYFEKPTAIHEKDTGKVDFITLSISGDVSEFQTDSFSPMGIIATRSLTPGRSSLLDAADARLDAISQFAASAFGNDTKKVYNKSSSDLGGGDDNGSGNGSGNGDESSGGNIDEKFKGRNNRTTAMGSALRLILVLMIILLIASLIVFFMRRKKNKEE